MWLPSAFITSVNAAVPSLYTKFHHTIFPQYRRTDFHHRIYLSNIPGSFFGHFSVTLTNSNSELAKTWVFRKISWVFLRTPWIYQKMKGNLQNTLNLTWLNTKTSVWTTFSTKSIKLWAFWRQKLILVGKILSFRILCLSFSENLLEFFSAWVFFEMSKKAWIYPKISVHTLN